MFFVFLGLRHKQRHQLEEFVAGVGVLGGVGSDVLEGPLQVLVDGQLTGEGPGLLAAHPQQTVIRRKHHPVESHHLGVLMICK